MRLNDLKIGDKIKFTKTMFNSWNRIVFVEDQAATITRLIPLMADDHYIFTDAEYIKL